LIQAITSLPARYDMSSIASIRKCPEVQCQGLYSTDYRKVRSAQHIPAQLQRARQGSSCTMHADTASRSIFKGGGGHISSSFLKRITQQKKRHNRPAPLFPPRHHHHPFSIPSPSSSLSIYLMRCFAIIRRSRLGRCCRKDRQRGSDRQRTRRAR
jgi:hypothetical protein